MPLLVVLVYFGKTYRNTFSIIYFSTLYSVSRACPEPRRLLSHCDWHAPGYIHRKEVGGATGRMKVYVNHLESLRIKAHHVDQSRVI